ncbi:MAG: phosphoglycerate kinase [Candidatus Malacoplasma girerdii]|nr:MAG: phosphoglycerate kinase [Candidatus Malacoplasma girerdii]
MNYTNKKTLKDLNLKNQTVLVRCDFNVPIKEGKIVDDKRIRAALETINYLLRNNNKVIALSHLSRIKSIEDIKSNKKTLAPVATRLGELLKDYEVKFCSSTKFDDIRNCIKTMKDQSVLLLENTRYYDVNEQNEVIKRESKNDPELAKFYASLATAFVNDAFGTAHRAHASNAGIASILKETSCIGFLVEKEINMISKAINEPIRPYVAILGGAKVSDKLKVISNLITKCDKIIITGGMAFTFNAASGKQIGKSICEPEMYDMARSLMKEHGDKLVISEDNLCTYEYADHEPTLYTIEQGIPHNLEGLDIGPKSIAKFASVLKDAKTIIWNGPCGVTEFSHFQAGTRAVAKVVKTATSNGCYSLIGGGDSASAIIQLGFKENDFSFISTGGGAALTLIEGSPLKGIDPIPNK